MIYVYYEVTKHVNHYLHPSKDTSVYTASNPFSFDWLSDLNFTTIFSPITFFTSHPSDGMVPHLLLENSLLLATFMDGMTILKQTIDCFFVPNVDKGLSLIHTLIVF